MIVLNKSNSEDSFVVTFTEKSTVGSPTYEITCIDTNNNVVIFSVTFEDDISPYPNRYNEFVINTASIFAEYPLGTYQYSAKETQSNTIVEVGKLLLKDNTNFEFTGYQSATTYKGYGG
jgi:hypothetical protein